MSKALAYPHRPLPHQQYTMGQSALPEGLTHGILHVLSGSSAHFCDPRPTIKSYRQHSPLNTQSDTYVCNLHGL